MSSYLQVLDELPKTASEKPQERILLQQFDPDAANVYTGHERRRAGKPFAGRRGFVERTRGTA